ncbi:MAG: tyrosine-type recombinase/integrase, partial [Solirubrobacteraceae bacterium]
FAHGNINVADAKTEAGVRKVDLSPMLRDEPLAWRASLDAPAPDSPFFPTRAGGRRDKDNINARVIRPAVRRANDRRALRDLPPLPARVTAHTLRRTYISMMFAAGAEIPYVMAQVGHGDSKVTLEIYAQVLKRRDREQVGRAFDHLLVGGGRASRTPRRGLRGARSVAPRQPRDAPAIPAESVIQSTDRAKDRAKTTESRPPACGDRSPETKKPSRLQGFLGMELGGLEPPTSWVRSRRTFAPISACVQGICARPALRSAAMVSPNFRLSQPRPGQRRRSLARSFCPPSC